MHDIDLGVNILPAFTNDRTERMNKMNLPLIRVRVREGFKKEVNWVKLSLHE